MRRAPGPPAAEGAEREGFTSWIRGLTRDDALDESSRPVALGFLYRLVRRVVELSRIHLLGATLAEDAPGS